MSTKDQLKVASSIFRIPENILLKIFSYLPVKDRCIAARVCRLWRRIVSDNSLWRHVNLMEYRLNLTKMWRVLRARLSPSLLTIKIKGFAQADSTRRTKASVSNAMLELLSCRCPQLRLLHLHECNMDNLSFTSLPASILSLGITSCTWKPRWMKDKQNHLPNLDSLNLSNSSRVDNFDVNDIAQWKHLKSLSLKGCYRVTGPGIATIAKSLLELESLNLISTGMDSLSVHHVARHLKQLRELFLGHCQDLVDSDIATIAAGLPCLTTLDLSCCESITVKGLESLFIRKITLLILVRKSRFSNTEVDALKKGFSQPVSITF